MKAEVPAPEAVLISNLSYQPQPFNPLRGKAEISFNLSKSAYVSGVIQDISGSTVKEYAPYLLAGGQHSIYWDGRLSRWRMVRPSWYTLTLSAADGHTSDQKSLEIAVSYGKPLKIYSLTVLPKRFRPPGQEALFRSVFSRDAYVTAQISAEDGTIVLSEQGLFWSRGINSYRWDGTDSQGVQVEPGTYTLSLAGADSGGNMSGISQTVIVLGERKPLRNFLGDLLNRLVGILF